MAEQKHAGNGSADQKPECDRAECDIDSKPAENKVKNGRVEKNSSNEEIKVKTQNS